MSNHLDEETFHRFLFGHPGIRHCAHGCRCGLCRCGKFLSYFGVARFCSFCGLFKSAFSSQLRPMKSLDVHEGLYIPGVTFQRFAKTDLDFGNDNEQHLNQPPAQNHETRLCPTNKILQVDAEGGIVWMPDCVAGVTTDYMYSNCVGNTIAVALYAIDHRIV